MGFRRFATLHATISIGALVVYACTKSPTDATLGPAVTPVLAAGGRTFVQVAAGFIHTCGLTADGAAFCWGSNEYSQLGADASAAGCGGLPCSQSPVEVSGGRRFRSIAAGWVHNCGISTDSNTYCWGGGAVGREGYLGDGKLSRSTLPVKVLADSAFVSIVIGDAHTCALTASGMAFCWGQNTWGELGDGTTTDRSTPVAVATQQRFRSISAGAYHTCGITLTNDAFCWGDNRWGELGTGDVAYNAVSAATRVPTAVSGNLRFSAVAAGWEHTCAIATTGSTYCWGRNEDARQLGDDSNITHRGVPGIITGSIQFTALAAGALATCGRTATNDVYCWGGDYYGSLGNGEAVASGVGHPVHTLGGPYAQVTIGQAHACGVASDRRLWCWGDQSAGQF
jgi:alpha-tubulin suppressor-like RCC1 family protein